MKLKFTDIEHFEEIRNGAVAYMEDGFPECDLRMVPIVAALNACESVAVRWCCEGHPTGTSEKDHFYVAMAIKDQVGLEYVVAIYEKAVEILSKKWNDYFIELNTGHLYFDDTSLWRRWCIEGYIDTDDKEPYISSLEEACRLVSEEHRYAEKSFSLA
jgi:hypothetical protein